LEPEFRWGLLRVCSAGRLLMEEGSRFMFWASYSISFIALSAATVYYIASRRLEFLKQHWLICGLFYGAAVDQVMTPVVLPLSALRAHGPYKLRDLLLGISVHMFTVGQPANFLQCSTLRE